VEGDAFLPFPLTAQNSKIIKEMKGKTPDKANFAGRRVRVFGDQKKGVKTFYSHWEANFIGGSNVVHCPVLESGWACLVTSGVDFDTKIRGRRIISTV